MVILIRKLIQFATTIYPDLTRSSVYSHKIKQNLIPSY